MFDFNFVIVYHFLLVNCLVGLVRGECWWVGVYLSLLTEKHRTFMKEAHMACLTWCALHFIQVFPFMSILPTNTHENREELLPLK